MRYVAEREGVNVVLVQEPYERMEEWQGWQKFTGQQGRKAKAEVWVREMGACKRREYESVNTAAVEVGGVIIMSVYEEPGQIRNDNVVRIINEVTARETGPVLIGGDFNAHHEAWGGNVTDGRGEELLEMIIAGNWTVWNEAAKGPTFMGPMGESWIDLTLSRGMDVDKWEILDEESMSGHRYIKFKLDLNKKNECKWNFDFTCTKWGMIERKLGEYVACQERELNQRVQDLNDYVRNVCKSYIRKKRIWMNEVQNEWWNERLSRNRQNVRNKRRKWQNERGTNDEQNSRTEYIDARNEYKKEIKRAKEEWLKNICQKMGDKDPWYRMWRMIGGSRSSVGIGTMLKDDGTYTRNERETDEYLVEKYFPQANMEAEIWGIPNTRDLPITEEEVSLIIRGMKPGKAVGEDGIPNEALPTIWRGIGGYWLELMNECFACGMYPTVWKSSKIVWVPKKGGTSFRPISLLPAMGRVFDKVVNNRVKYTCESGDIFSKEQFGFRKARGTIQACERLAECIKQKKREGVHALVVALDITNAFNCLNPGIVVRVLLENAVAGNLIRLCLSFMRQRQMKTRQIENVVERGCPQGSSLGPTLWIIAMEKWFGAMRDIRERTCVEGIERVWFQAYADDQVVVVSGNSVREVERIWERVWYECEEWAESGWLKYNMVKTQAMFISSRKIRPPVIKDLHHTIPVEPTMDYLGITFDRALNYVAHSQKVRSRVGECMMKFKGIIGRILGRDKGLVRTVVDKIIRPTAMYGAEIWGERAEDSRVIRNLRAAERYCLLAITGAYRTASTSALEVISGVVPFQVEALARYQERNESKEKMELQGLYECHMAHPAWESAGALNDIQLADTQIWVDASWIRGESVGIGKVILRGGRTTQYCTKIRNMGSNNQAEGAAVLWALEGVLEEECIDAVRVYTDSAWVTNHLRDPGVVKVCHRLRQAAEKVSSRNPLQISWMNREDRSMVLAHQMADRARKGMMVEEDWGIHGDRGEMRKDYEEKLREMWQTKWHNNPDGRWTFRFSPEVGFDNLKLSRKGVQLLTGHGNFKGYLRRFRLLRDGETATCGCGIEEEETVEHVWDRCMFDWRRKVRENWDRNIVLRSNGVGVRENLSRWCEWAESLVREEAE